MAKGAPYEFADENTVAVFDDEVDREKWLELAAEPGGLMERQAKIARLKNEVDGMTDDMIDDLLERLEI